MHDTDHGAGAHRARLAHRTEAAWLDWAAIDLIDRGPDTAAVTLAQGAAVLAAAELRGGAR